MSPTKFLIEYGIKEQSISTSTDSDTGQIITINTVYVG